MFESFGDISVALLSAVSSQVRQQLIKRKDQIRDKNAWIYKAVSNLVETQLEFNLSMSLPHCRVPLSDQMCWLLLFFARTSFSSYYIIIIRQLRR